MLSKRLSRCVLRLITSEEALPPLFLLPTKLPDCQCALVSPKLLISIALFKLKPFNLVATIFLPTFMAIQVTASDVEKHIENMELVHHVHTLDRIFNPTQGLQADRGLGGTKNSNGLNESSNQGHNPNINISSSMLFEGAVPEGLWCLMKIWNNNPFMRHHNNIFQYSLNNRKWASLMRLVSHEEVRKRKAIKDA